MSEPNISFRKMVYRTPNRAKAETGHKEFDRQCDYIGTGNVYSNAQTSSFVRPFTETECNNMKWNEGELREFDLKPFVSSGMPTNVLAAVKELTVTEQVVLYWFHSCTKGKVTTHGYLITNVETHELLKKFYTGPTSKSKRVVDWCQLYVTPLKE